MPIQLRWQDNANNETKQNLYVCDGFNSAPVLLKTVGANLTTTEVTLNETHPAPAFITIEAANQLSKSPSISYYVDANGDRTPVAFTKVATEMYSKRRVPQSVEVTAVTPNFDQNFGKWLSAHVLGNGDIVAVFPNAAVHDLVVYDRDTFAEKARVTTEAQLVHGVVAADGKYYFAVKGVEATKINSFDGTTVVEAMVSPSANFLDHGCYLSDQGFPRFYSFNGTNGWFVEVNYGAGETTKVDVRKAVYGTNETDNLDGYNERMAYQSDQYLVFVRAQVQNGSTYKLIITRVDQTTGEQEQQVVNNYFFDIDKSNLVVTDHNLSFHCARNHYQATVSWEYGWAPTFDTTSWGDVASLVEMPNGEVLLPTNGGEGIILRNYSRNGTSPDDRTILAFPGLTLGSYGVLRTQSGVLFYDVTNKVACLVKPKYMEVQIDGKLLGIDYQAGANYSPNHQAAGFVHMA